MIKDRIPFALAISDPKLLKSHFDTLSVPQQVVLKAFNGLALSGEPNSRSRWTELEHWAILQGSAEFDALGFPISVTPLSYTPKKYNTCVAILGRRSGKTDRITSTQIAYEALLGGHMDHVTPGQDVQILFIAQDIDMAKSHLNFIYQAINSSPLLLKEIEKFNADSILLKSGLKIVPAPPTITSSRGLAVPGWCGDEVGFWYTDAKAANPDFEVERAVEYAMAQFPNEFKFITSTPYTKEGMLWKYHQGGTDGCRVKDAEDKEEYEGVLVVHAPTAAMENPRISPKKLKRLQRKDPEAFVRESLARFVDSISGYFNPAKVDAAVDLGIKARTLQEGMLYVAAMDPAFRSDNFAFTIEHHDPLKGIVQDWYQEWVPEMGIPLNPSEVLAEIKLKLDEFGLAHVYSDQAQLESLQQLAIHAGFTIIGHCWTKSNKAPIYSSLRTQIHNNRMRLLDIKPMLDQLKGLEKKLTQGGTVQIAAGKGKRDDAASAMALATSQCLWLLPQQHAKQKALPSHVDEGWAQIQRNRRRAEGDGPDNEGEFDLEDLAMAN